MKSIKDKVEDMIKLAKGGQILRTHAEMAGIAHEEDNSSYLKVRSKKAKGKQ